MRRNTVPDPPWKSGPPEPKHRHREHAIDPEPAGYDHDGVGVDEAERIDGEPLCTVREAYVCHREGCDVDPQKNHVYGLADVDQMVIDAVYDAIEYTDDPNTEDVVEYLAINAIIVDYDEAPILGFEFSRIDEPLGYVSPQFTDKHGFAGPCHGRAEPNPDVDAYRYDL